MHEPARALRAEAVPASARVNCRLEWSPAVLVYDHQIVRSWANGANEVPLESSSAAGPSPRPSRLPAPYASQLSPAPSLELMRVVGSNIVLMSDVKSQLSRL